MPARVSSPSGRRRAARRKFARRRVAIIGAVGSEEPAVGVWLIPTDILRLVVQKLQKSKVFLRSLRRVDTRAVPPRVEVGASGTHW
jgi:hypothetical protein